MRFPRATIAIAVVVASLAVLPAGGGAKTRKTQPVSITLLAGSTSTLDLGAGNVRTISLSGKLRGTTDGRIDLTKPIRVKLVGGQIVPGPVTVFDDPTCPATPLLTTDARSRVTLDKKRESTSVLDPKTGRVTGSAATRLRIVLNLRSAGCGGPLEPTGYADTFARFRVKGKIAPTTGLRSLELNSSTMPIEIQGCTTAGNPVKKCGGKPIGYRGKISVHLLVQVDLGAGTTRAIP
jgi:hypothetical protein